MELREAKREALQVAKELFYSENTKKKIRNAKSVNEISRILATARSTEL